MWIEESYPKMIEIKAKFAMLRSSYHVSEKVILEYILDEELCKETNESAPILKEYKIEVKKSILKEKIPKKDSDFIRKILRKTYGKGQHSHSDFNFGI